MLLFSKTKVKNIFIEGHRTNEQQKKVIFRNRLNKLNFDKTFEDIIESELDFHGSGAAEIEVQQQADDINPFKCELHQTLLDVLYFNPALKVINITMAYQNDENDVDFGVAEKQDVLNLLMASAHAVREKCPNTELFLVRIFLYLD